MNRIQKHLLHILTFLLFSLLFACTTMQSSLALQEGKRDFNTGYYKSAMRNLLPLASDGNRDAQYAVGYMYYYGYGVAQDTDVAYFWVKRSADQHYEPAIKALALMKSKKK